MSLPLMDYKVTHVYHKNWFSKARVVINRGGTRSSKTYSICQQLIHWLCFGEIRNGHFLMEGRVSVFRKYRATSKVTVMREFEAIIAEYGLGKYIKKTKGNLNFTFKNRVVEFMGADDLAKVHGYKANVVYMNEADELDYNTFRQLDFRCTDFMIIDLNPKDPYTWINTKLEKKRARTKGDVETIVSTYKDNPYLTAAQISSIEYTKTEDPDYWNVYGLGQYGKVFGLVIPEIKIVAEMPDQLKYKGAGMDFGFNDPTTLIEGGVLNRKDLFLDEWLHASYMKTNDIDVTLRVMEFPRRELLIQADSANPGMIAELKDRRFKIQGVKKGAGSLLYGINLLNQYNIHVTERSANLIKEQTKYVYKVGKDGSLTNEPVDAWNHCWDGARYYGRGNLKPIVPINKRGQRHGTV